MAYGALLFIATSLVNIERLFDTWGQVNKMSVYLAPGTESGERQQVVDFLKKQKLVENVQLITSAESAKEFEQRFSKVSSQKIDSEQMAKFFPEFLVIDLNQTLAYKSGLGPLDDFVTNIKSTFTSIKNVSYGKTWLQRYVGVLAAVQSVGWFLIIAFLVASVIVASNVIKTTLYSRRDEIEIMEFIGADDFSIYCPQIINTIFLSIVSFSASGVIVYIFLKQIQQSGNVLFESTAFEQMVFIGPSLLIKLFFVSTIAVALYSTYTIYSLLPRRKKAILVKGVLH